MGYLFQAVPADLLSAEPPRVVPTPRGADRERYLTPLFLTTALAVPEFRSAVMQLVGARGLGGRAEVYGEVRFRGEPDDPKAAALTPDGLIRAKGPGGYSALVVSTRQSFEADNPLDVARVARHLTLAREQKIQRVIALANTVPDQAFIEAVRSHPSAPGTERLKGVTWMETVDAALHLLDRKVVRSPVSVFLLENYVGALKEAAVRDIQSRTAQPEGAIFFRSLGNDWFGFVEDRRQGQAVDERDPRLAAIAANWLSFLRFFALYLTRGAQRDEDILEFPNVRGSGLASRKSVVMRRIIADSTLLASFQRHDETVPTVLGVDLKKAILTMQLELDGPPAKGATRDGIRDLARSFRDDRTSGTTRVKIFWPTEKSPRLITREQALADPIATAPPQHGMLPERFIVERTVPCDGVIADPDIFIQLVMLELRGFRASVRQLLRRGIRFN
jgi:hypothetical protein